MYPAPKGATDLPGLEVSGEIAAIGPNVKNVRIGDKVCTLLTGGGYAEYCIGDAPLMMPIPKGFTMTEAAAICETYFTVYSNVFMRAGLRPGEKFLVHGGTSGIGTTAIQLAKASDCTVYTTAEGTDKCKACLGLGADYAIDYTSDTKFEDVIAETTEKKGVDVILDMICGDYVQRNIKSLNEDGRLVIIALMHGPKAQVSFTKLMLKRLTITGSTLRSRPVSVKQEIATKLLQNVWPLLEQRKVKPIIHKEFPMEQIVEAHQMMEKNEHIGKIVVKIDDNIKP